MLNFIGPKNEERIIVYNNGEKAASDQTINMNNNFTHGKGRIVIGRHYSELNGKYTSVQLDELLFFNKALMDAQVMLLSKYIYYAEHFLYITSTPITGRYILGCSDLLD